MKKTWNNPNRIRKTHSTVKFVKGWKNKKGLCNLMIYYSAHKVIKQASLGIFVDPDWSEETCKDEIILMHLDNWRKKVNQIEIAIMRDGREITSEEVMKGLKIPNYLLTSDNIIDFIDFWCRKKKEKKKEASLQNYNLVATYLRQWGPDITFQNMSDELLSSFEDWLLKKKFVNNTVNKIMTSLLFMMGEAEKANLEVHQSYKNFEPVELNNTKEVITLSEGELDKIATMELPDNLDKVRDLFVMSCSTGARYCDVVLFDWENIKGDFISYRPIKTIKFGIKVEVPINRHSRAIIEKNRGNNRLLKPTSNDNCNKKIKEICKLAGMDELIEVNTIIGSETIVEKKPKYELIQMHTGRRTFCTLYSKKGAPDHLIMKYSGHKSHDSLKRYIGFDKETEKKFMELWDK